MTRKACVIGWPIKHSRSPLIHGHWLKAYEIAGTYEKVAVAPDDLGDFLQSLRAGAFVGCNVTVPHKETVFAAADHCEPEAVSVGAANTLWLEGGRLCATNTDTYGFMSHLQSSAPAWTPASGTVAVLGAGGAARAIVHGLLQAGVPKVRLYNRTAERAAELADHFGAGVEAGAWDGRSTELDQVSLLVNTTSLGMDGSAPLEIDLSGMARDAVVADIVYAPLETELLKQAKTRGLTCVDGLGMLLHQAVPGFEKWFGVRPEVTDELRALVVADLEKGQS